jgi:hypothetical protein
LIFFFTANLQAGTLLVCTDFPSVANLGNYTGAVTALAGEAVSLPVFFVYVVNPMTDVREMHIVTVYTDGGKQDCETHHGALRKVTFACRFFSFTVSPPSLIALGVQALR